MLCDLREVDHPPLDGQQTERVGGSARDRRGRARVPVEKSPVVRVAVRDELPDGRVGPPSAGESGQRNAATDAQDQGKDRHRPPRRPQFGSRPNPDETHGSTISQDSVAPCPVFSHGGASAPMVVSRCPQGVLPVPTGLDVLGRRQATRPKARNCRGPCGHGPRAARERGQIYLSITGIWRRSRVRGQMCAGVDSEPGARNSDARSHDALRSSHRSPACHRCHCPR